MKSYSMLKDKKGQEVNKLYAFVLLIVLVGMIIGIGIITLDKFGATTFYNRYDATQNLTSTHLLNYTAYNLNYGNITNVDFVRNTSSSLPGECYNVNKTPGQFEFRNETANCNAVMVSNGIYIQYDYKEYDTETGAATRNVMSEIANIASDWLGLIVTVFVLAIILFFVIRSFNPNAGR